MIVRLSSRGRISLPAQLREQDEILAGQKFEIERLGNGDYRLIKVPEPHKDGLVDWLLACPTKGWFRQVESEFTHGPMP